MLVVMVAAVVAFTYVVSYNGLVSDRQQVADAWAVIDVELERRHTLIPGLVTAVRATAPISKRWWCPVRPAAMRSPAP